VDLNVEKCQKCDLSERMTIPIYINNCSVIVFGTAVI
jgi:hypothetical protein